MSDPKRATLITVGAPKSAKNNVNKTVRLTINLVESNESKYPELNYKELVIAEERKKKTVENGKTTGLDPFTDDDDDVARVARKFEQKYGGKSTYGRTGRSKHDDFADIGAGYDENDSFIDNTHGYDEMIPPECDTLYGGFYINCGSLEFKTVPENQTVHSDGEPGNRRNKRRMISSSSSDQESSESSSESSQDVKEKVVANGEVSSHKTEHRKKKNKKIDKKKAKKVRRTDSSAANSGKQTSDDNAHGDAESADSRTSQSDSLTSKPAPSSENAVTSDSSRDAEKVEIKLPAPVVQAIEELEAAVKSNDASNPASRETSTEQCLNRLERALSKCSCDAASRKAAWSRAARSLGTTRAKLLQRVKPRPDNNAPKEPTPPPPTATPAQTTSSKRKADDEDEDFARLTAQEREAKIVDTLQRLKLLIDERKPDMISNYNAECARVQEEKKKLQVASAVEGAPHVEKRLPKRRFPWCPRSRALLVRLKKLAGTHEAAATLLAKRALPLFPNGFVRMPTLLRQADLNKDIKATDVKRQRLGSASQPALPTPPPFAEPIHFPSSLTVTTTTNQAPPATKPDDDKYKPNSMLGTFFNISKDLIVERPEDRKKDDRVKEDLYVPPNNIGSITITPVISAQPKDKKTTAAADKPKEGLIRVKSPAALNEMVKKDKLKKPEKTNHVKEKRVDTPLHIDTNLQPSKKDPSPKSKDEISPKQIESMRVAENNIPRPALVPVRHSPTFAKPDKRPPEVKKKKDVLIISDVDPLGDVQPEPLTVDDSSSDVELVEDSKNADKSEPKSGDNKSDTVPSKDIVSDSKKVNSVKHKERSSKEDKEKRSDSLDETTKEIDNVMREIREMQNSQEPTKLSSNSYAGVITSARHEKSSSQPAFASRASIFGETRSDKDKLTNFFEQNGWM
ncbi:hypothetical protein ABMA27_002986 [Loxostege sticticalis]|uniref:Ubinuclein-1 n=2 Tax=Loxostege sticticalis TaxID=481309 RepID=A0ABR3HRL8_LOXSC